MQTELQSAAPDPLSSGPRKQQGRRLKIVCDTCGCVLVDNGDGTGSYTFTPGVYGGTSCTVGVACSDGATAATQPTGVTVAFDRTVNTQASPMARALVTVAMKTSASASV